MASREGFEREKFVAAVLQLLWGCQSPPGIVALVKLVWYADYWHYQQHLRTITGANYVAMPEGPVVDGYRDLFGALEANGYVSVEEVPIQDQPYPKRQFRPLMAPKQGLLSDDEIETLDRVAEDLGWMTGKALARKSHSEPPWIFAFDEDSPNNPIPYILFRWIDNLPTDGDDDIQGIVQRIAMERADDIAVAERFVASLKE